MKEKTTPMDHFKFSTLPYKRPDLEARRAKDKDWKAAVEQAESYEALRGLIFEIDRANCELSTQFSTAILWFSTAKHGFPPTFPHT